MSWYTFRGNESSVHIIARPNPRVLNSVRIALFVLALTRSQKKVCFFFLFFKSAYFLSCFAGMKAQASQVQLFKYSFCLSYRAAYTPTELCQPQMWRYFFPAWASNPIPPFRRKMSRILAGKKDLLPSGRQPLLYTSQEKGSFLYFFSSVNP